MQPFDRILEIARAEVGNGEYPPGSNAGEHVDKYLGAEYKPGREWCAGFVSWCLETAGFRAPMQGRARRGARALVRWVGGNGYWIATPAQAKTLRELPGIPLRKDPYGITMGYPLPGDVICWKRSRLGWQCHVALVADYDPATGRMAVIEGNVGGKVRRTVLEAHEWPRRMRGLYGIARPRSV